LISLGVLLVGAASPATAAGHFSMYPIPTPDSGAIRMVAGPDGNLWFVETAGNKIGRVTTSGVFTEFALPTAKSGPQDITVGPDGALWFVEGHPGRGAVGRITTDGAITEYLLPPKNLPVGIATGSDGNLWITIPGQPFLRRITPQGLSTKYPLPHPVGTPGQIIAGPDGDLWFAVRSPNKIDRIDPVTGAVTEFALGNATYPNDLTSGPDGNVWFTATNEMGSLTVDGALAEYPAPLNSLGSITTGPDSQLWLRIKDSLGRMDPADPGHATTFRVPGGSGPGAITSGPDGRMWFTVSVGTVMPNTVGAYAP
jgi:streptogramin lyase